MKRVVTHGNQSFSVQFKYERLPIFCFLCGRLGHSDKFYNRLFDGTNFSKPKGWGAWLRPMARQSRDENNPWLLDSFGFSSFRVDAVKILSHEPGTLNVDAKNNSMDYNMVEEMVVPIDESKKRQGLGEDALLSGSVYVPQISPIVSGFHANIDQRQPSSNSIS